MDDVRRKLTHCAVGTWILALTAIIGCSRTDKPTVSGTVTFDGAPVEQGEIRMLPIDGAGPSSGTTIVAGRYELATTPGAKRVEIQAYRQTGTQPADPQMPGSNVAPVLEPYLPTKYNSASELTLQVDGALEHDFALTTP